MTRILIVEDDEFSRDMLDRRLQKKGFETLIAVNGAEAVEIAFAELPDLILMDIALPVMDGLEATKQIRREPQTQNIPIIALTAHAFLEDREKCLAAGCNAYDSKPVNFPNLLAKIEQFLSE